MALKTIIDADAFDQLPETLKEFYNKDEQDKYVLQTDSKEKINEFRDNNRNLYKENEDLKKVMIKLENEQSKNVFL